MASGAIQPGELLPSIRPLAEELPLNRNTVAKAYTELESQGLIETQAGRGCFARAGGAPLRKDARLKLLTAEIDDAVTQAHHLQVVKGEFLELAEARFELFAQKRSRAASE